MTKRPMTPAEMGRKGGSAKVPKGAAKWTAKKKSAIAKRAAKARWSKTK